MMESAANYYTTGKNDKFRRMASGVQAREPQPDGQYKKKKDKVISVEEIEEGMPVLNLKPRMGISAS